MNTLESQEQLVLENKQLRETVSKLEEQLEWFRRQIFGKRSEKIVVHSNDQQLVFEGFESIEAEPQKKQPVKGHERKAPKRDGQDALTFPDDLPIEEIYLDIPEEQKICPTTGILLVKIGEEVCHKLASKPGSYFIKKFIRPKYAHPQKSEDGVRTAELPPALLNRCQADNSLLADILVKKYADHCPLYRISEIFGRDNIFISRQLISQWVLKCGQALKPLCDEMQRQILNSGNIFIDETPVKMLDPGAGKTKLTYMWVVSGGNTANPAYRVYHFRDNRQHHNAVELLKGFEGIVHSDKYGAYETLAQKKQFTWCPCWAHIRRKFFEAEHGDKEFRQMVLNKIGELFTIEQEAWTKSPEERLTLRQQRAAPIIDELTEQIKDKLIHGKILPKSNFREALGYYISLIPFLKNYTLHSWARLDNNVAERAVRPIAIGRKNWLFLGSHDGGEAAAVSLSLIQTCRALGINPRTYLESVMGLIMDYNSKNLVDLLPDNWTKRFSL